jgi:alanine transaminase
MEYAVRGLLVLRAEEHAKRLAMGEKMAFDDLVFCNIGNPQSVGQHPITFFRQVLSLCVNPLLLENDAVVASMPQDVVTRARGLLNGSVHGVGAYSHSKGVGLVREHVSEFIAERDGHQSNPDHIFLTNGASDGVKTVINMLVRGADDGIMIPIPQYPLYSATVTACGGTQVPYYLDEGLDWSISMQNLNNVVTDAKANGTNVRAMAIINPGNPTGQVMTQENLQDIVRFCHSNSIVLMADEVYQANIYGDRPFISMKKTLRESDPLIANELELASFHSCSKGMLGECGMRGGYMELTNFQEDTLDQVYKALSVSLCSNVTGQFITSLMVRPPREGDESYPLFAEEQNAIFSSLQRRSAKLVKALNGMDGVTCNACDGAMYAFPNIQLPQGAVEKALEKGLTPDTYYSLELLDATGICVVPGSGFGQEDGTFHVRTTFLPPENKMDEVIDRMGTFHQHFVQAHS